MLVLSERRRNEKRRQVEVATQALSESAGQRLSPEELEGASLGRIRIMSEMGHRRATRTVGARSVALPPGWFEILGYMRP